MKKRLIFAFVCLLILAFVSSFGVNKYIPLGTPCADADMILGTTGITPAGGGGLIGLSTQTDAHTVYEADGYFHSKFTTTTAGDVQYAHLYVHDSNSETLCLSLFNSAGTELLSCTGTRADNSAGWVNCDAGATYELAAATEYYISVYVNDGGGSFDVGNDTGTNMWKEQSLSPTCGTSALDTAEETVDKASYDITAIWNNSAGDP
jgi:hypothetical protein